VLPNEGRKRLVGKRSRKDEFHMKTETEVRREIRRLQDNIRKHGTSLDDILIAIMRERIDGLRWELRTAARGKVDTTSEMTSVR
jgi:hypothetical protein